MFRLCQTTRPEPQGLKDLEISAYTDEIPQMMFLMFKVFFPRNHENFSYASYFLQWRKCRFNLEMCIIYNKRDFESFIQRV